MFPSTRTPIRRVRRRKFAPAITLPEPQPSFNDAPAAENILRFTSRHAQFPVGAVIYADFECFLPPDGTHVPSGFCTYVVSQFRDFKPFLYSGADVMGTFFHQLDVHAAEIDSLLKRDLPMIPLVAGSAVDLAYRAATICDCCEKPFDPRRNHKVHHHCHITGEYIGPMCNNCNLALKYRRQKENHFFIPVILHNLKGYDSHLILKHLPPHLAARDIHVIATTTEKYISFSIGNLRFLDSLQFLNCSLDTLAANLKLGGVEKFVHTRRHFPNPAHFNLVCQKGIFPYEYMSSAEKFNEDRLPPIGSFYSSLTETNVTEEDYHRAQTVWTTFDMTTMRDYHDLYLLTDVLLLADVFEEFRKVSLTHYKLDPCHHFSAPGLSLQACLRMTDVHLELIYRN